MKNAHKDISFCMYNPVVWFNLSQCLFWLHVDACYLKHTHWRHPQGCLHSWQPLSVIQQAFIRSKSLYSSTYNVLWLQCYTNYTNCSFKWNLSTFSVNTPKSLGCSSPHPVYSLSSPIRPLHHQGTQVLQPSHLPPFLPIVKVHKYYNLIPK